MKKLPIDHQTYLCSLIRNMCDFDYTKEQRNRYDKMFQLRLERLERMKYDVVQYYNIYQWEKKLSYRGIK